MDNGKFYTEQVNIRVPVESKTLVLLIGRMLREDPTAHARLYRFINDGPSASSMAEIWDVVERHEAQLKAIAAAFSPLNSREVPNDNVIPDITQFTKQSGLYRKLTEAGRREAVRRYKEGERQDAIAEFMGVSQASISRALIQSRGAA